MNDATLISVRASDDEFCALIKRGWYRIIMLPDSHWLCAHDRIIRTDDTCFGRVRFANTRVTVEHAGLLAQRYTEQEFFEHFPRLQPGDMQLAKDWLRYRSGA